MYAEFSSLIEEGLAGTNWTVSSTIPADSLVRFPGQTDLIVTVGSEALRKTLGKGDSTPVIATLLPAKATKESSPNFAAILDESRQSTLTNRLPARLLL